MKRLIMSYREEKELNWVSEQLKENREEILRLIEAAKKLKTYNEDKIVSN